MWPRPHTLSLSALTAAQGTAGGESHPLLLHPGYRVGTMDPAHASHWTPLANARRSRGEDGWVGENKVCVPNWDSDFWILVENIIFPKKNVHVSGGWVF